MDDAGQRPVHAHVLPSDVFLTLGSVCEMCAGAGKSQRRRTQQAEHFSQDILHDTTDSGSLKTDRTEAGGGVRTGRGGGGSRGLGLALVRGWREASTSLAPPGLVGDGGEAATLPSVGLPRHCG